MGDILKTIHGVLWPLIEPIGKPLMEVLLRLTVALVDLLMKAGLSEDSAKNIGSVAFLAAFVWLWWKAYKLWLALLKKAFASIGWAPAGKEIKYETYIMETDDEEAALEARPECQSVKSFYDYMRNLGEEYAKSLPYYQKLIANHRDANPGKVILVQVTKV